MRHLEPTTVRLSPQLDSSETFPAHDLPPSRVPTLIDLTSSLPPHPPDRSAQVECSTWHSALGTTN